MGYCPGLYWGWGPATERAWVTTCILRNGRRAASVLSEGMSSDTLTGALVMPLSSQCSAWKASPQYPPSNAAVPCRRIRSDSRISWPQAIQCATEIRG